jgi:hypothetical protein
MELVPAIKTMPGSVPAPATSAIWASLTTDDAGVVADAAHDGSDDRRIALAIHAGDAEADRLRPDPAIADGIRHHGVQDLLHFQLADGLQIGARRPGLRQHMAVVACQKTDRLDSACIDADDVPHLEPPRTEHWEGPASVSMAHRLRRRLR